MKTRTYTIAELIELWAAAHSRQQAEAGDRTMLRERLLAGRATPHEQAFLAELLAGKVKRPAHRPANDELRVKRRQAAFFVNVLESRGLSAKAAWSHVADFFDAKPGTVRDWIGDVTDEAGEGWPAMVADDLAFFAELRPALMAEPRIAAMLEVAE